MQHRKISSNPIKHESATKGTDLGEKSKSSSPKNSFFHPMSVVVFIFVILTIATVFITYRTFQRAQNFEFKLPKDIEDIVQMREKLSTLLQSNWFSVLLFFSSLFILKQTFSIPGSALMNILAGNLFGFNFGLPLVCLLTATGASCCYWLSYAFGRSIIRKFFPHRVMVLSKAITSHKEDLFYYLLFLRLVPFTPNWLLNVVSPVVDVPFFKFFFSIFFGLIPYNFVTVSAGSILSNLKSAQDVFDIGTLLKIFVIAIASLIPVILKKRTSNSKPLLVEESVPMNS